MEEGFIDISNIKWIVILAIGVILRFFTAKPRVVQMPSEEDGDRDEGSELGERDEQILRDARMFAAGDEMNEGSRRVRQERRGRAVNPRVASAPTEGLPGEIKDENLEEESRNIAEDFDLRKAVIMSEILSRKYDE